MDLEHICICAVLDGDMQYLINYHLNGNPLTEQLLYAATTYGKESGNYALYDYILLYLDIAHISNNFQTLAL